MNLQEIVSYNKYNSHVNVFKDFGEEVVKKDVKVIDMPTTGTNISKSFWDVERYEDIKSSNLVLRRFHLSIDQVGGKSSEEIEEVFRKAFRKMAADPQYSYVFPEEAQAPYSLEVKRIPLVDLLGNMSLENVRFFMKKRNMVKSTIYQYNQPLTSLDAFKQSVERLAYRVLGKLLGSPVLLEGRWWQRALKKILGPICAFRRVARCRYIAFGFEDGPKNVKSAIQKVNKTLNEIRSLPNCKVFAYLSRPSYMKLANTTGNGKQLACVMAFVHADVHKEGYAPYTERFLEESYSYVNPTSEERLATETALDRITTPEGGIAWLGGERPFRQDEERAVDYWIRLKDGEVYTLTKEEVENEENRISNAMTIEEYEHDFKKADEETAANIRYKNEKVKEMMRSKEQEEVNRWDEQYEGLTADKKYTAVRYWDDIDDETVLLSSDDKQEAQSAINRDQKEYGSRIFVREHVLYRIDEK